MTIEINDLRFQAILGILEHERTTPQNIIVSVRIQYPYSPSHFIDYAEITELIERKMVEQKFELIETAITFFQLHLKKQFPSIEHLFIHISKPDIMDNCSVGVSDTLSFL